MTAGSARFAGSIGAATKRDFWSTTTSSPTRTGAKRSPRTSSSDVGRTTRTNRNGSSDHGRRCWSGNSVQTQLYGIHDLTGREHVSEHVEACQTAPANVAVLMDRWSDALREQRNDRQILRRSGTFTDLASTARRDGGVLAPERYKVQLTITPETRDKLRRVQVLMRHAIPDGDPAIVFDRALTLLLEDLEHRKLAAVGRPWPARDSKSASRHVPAAVRREVWARDEGQCAFVGARRRCGLDCVEMRPRKDSGEGDVLQRLHGPCSSFGSRRCQPTQDFVGQLSIDLCYCRQTLFEMRLALAVSMSTLQGRRTRGWELPGNASCDIFGRSAHAAEEIALRPRREGSRDTEARVCCRGRPA